MIGMDFVSFLVLLVISVIVSAVLHYGLRYQVVPGLSSFFGKVVLGWLGAWLGTPVFGRWFAGAAYEEVFLIPAILGSLAMLVLVIDVVKTFTSGSEAEASAAETTTL